MNPYSLRAALLGVDRRLRKELARESSMSALLERLDAHKPALWLEVAPPRGIAVDSMLTRLDALRGHVDAINLVDNALGRVKLVAAGVRLDDQGAAWGWR